MRYGCSNSCDYGSKQSIVIRDFGSKPAGRVVAMIPRVNAHEAQQIAQVICDLLNNNNVDLSRFEKSNLIKELTNKPD